VATVTFERDLRVGFQFGRQHNTGHNCGIGMKTKSVLDGLQPVLVGSLVVVDPGDVASMNLA
jgi:hypothetical protein